VMIGIAFKSVHGSGFFHFMVVFVFIIKIDVYVYTHTGQDRIINRGKGSIELASEK
jgi:hypothetical protein